MAAVTASIQLRRDTLANWQTSTATLKDGEVAIAYDTNGKPTEIRIGSGSGSTYSQSPNIKLGETVKSITIDGSATVLTPDATGKLNIPANQITAGFAQTAVLAATASYVSWSNVGGKPDNLLTTTWSSGSTSQFAGTASKALSSTTANDGVSSFGVQNSVLTLNLNDGTSYTASVQITGSVERAELAERANKDSSGNIITSSYAAGIEGTGMYTIKLKAKDGSYLGQVSDIHASYADSASKDRVGNSITTYVKSLSWNSSNNSLRVTNGGGTSSDMPIATATSASKLVLPLTTTGYRGPAIISGSSFRHYGATYQAIEITLPGRVSGGGTDPKHLYFAEQLDGGASFFPGETGIMDLGYRNTTVSEDYSWRNLYLSGQVSQGTASDRRLKENIEYILPEDADTKLKALKPVSFDWNSTAKALGPGILEGHSMSFLADEFTEVLPEAGGTVYGKYGAIKIEQVIPLLVAGYQKQQQEIDELKAEIAALKSKS